MFIYGDLLGKKLISIYKEAFSVNTRNFKIIKILSVVNLLLFKIRGWNPYQITIAGKLC